MRSFIDRSAMTRAHQLTRFPLTGAHLAADCESCHQPTAGEMLFTMRVSTCNECHARNYQATSNPNHAAVGFTRDCAQCHVAVSWQVAQFDHGGTAFPLTGAHRTAPCVDCHVSSGTRPSALCVSCHQSDYNGAADPSHTQSQFPTDCVVCHTTTAWQPASYRNHDAQFFRIYSGAHAGRWGSCATCHVNPGNYTQFDCLSCHRASGTNQDHSGVSGYTYDSPSCYRCHRSS
jgi:hypothetical protein